MQKLSELSDLVEIILDTIPLPIFLVDREVRIIGLNHAAERLLEGDTELSARRRAGEVLHCVRSTESVDGCGGTEACKNCVIRRSINQALAGNRTVRQRETMALRRGIGSAEIHLLVTTAPLEPRDEPLALLILEDITDVMKLKSILPVCASCKKIRDDHGYWDQIEAYLSHHSESQFSHSICPDCARQLYPELFEDEATESEG